MHINTFCLFVFVTFTIHNKTSQSPILVSLLISCHRHFKIFYFIVSEFKKKDSLVSSVNQVDSSNTSNMHQSRQVLKPSDLSWSQIMGQKKTVNIKVLAGDIHRRIVKRQPYKPSRIVYFLDDDTQVVSADSLQTLVSNEPKVEKIEKSESALESLFQNFLNGLTKLYEKFIQFFQNIFS